MFRMLLALILLLSIPADIPPNAWSTLQPRPPQAPLNTANGIANAGQIKGLCLRPENAGDGQFDMCLGYLAGSLDQLVAQDSANGKSARRLCPNRAITLEEFRLLFVQCL